MIRTFDYVTRLYHKKVTIFRLILGEKLLQKNKNIWPEAEKYLFSDCQEIPLWCYLKRLVEIFEARGCCKFFKVGRGGPMAPPFAPFGLE